MSDHLYCPKHQRSKVCLGGESAHISNWYCQECDKDTEIADLRAQLAARDAEIATMRPVVEAGKILIAVIVGDDHGWAKAMRLLRNALREYESKVTK